MPTGAQVAQQRLAVCRTCINWRGQCSLGHDPNNQAGCPIGKFSGFMALGDAVAKIARPVAVVLNMTGCGGCKRRQDRLNHLIRT